MNTLPGQIRKPLSKIVLKPIYRVLNRILTRVRVAQSSHIPVVEVREEHIRNLRVVLDRNAFLEALPKGGIVAELGVDRGDFSARILSIAQPRRLHLIDMWSSARYHRGLEKHVRDRFAQELETSQVQINVGRSTDALARFPDRYFDWVYIDTDHGYSVTVQELHIARQKVKANGIIAGHDYVTGYWYRGARYGVVEAVNEFCVQHGWELLLLTHETDRHLSFAIRRMTA